MFILLNYTDFFLMTVFVLSDSPANASEALQMALLYGASIIYYCFFAHKRKSAGFKQCTKQGI